MTGVQRIFNDGKSERLCREEICAQGQVRAVLLRATHRDERYCRTVKELPRLHP
jgi:hypothetical protein